MKSPILSKLSNVRISLAEGENDDALLRLQAIKDSGVNDATLDHFISALGNGEVAETLAWVKRSIQRAKSGETNIFSEHSDDSSVADVFNDIGALVGDADMQIIDTLDGFSQFEDDKAKDLFSSTSESDFGEGSLSGAFVLPPPTSIKSKRDRLRDKLAKLSEASEVTDPNKQTRPFEEPKDIGLKEISSEVGEPKVMRQVTPRAIDAIDRDDPFADLGIESSAAVHTDIASPMAFKSPAAESSDISFDLGLAAPNQDDSGGTRPVGKAEESVDIDLGLATPNEVDSGGTRPVGKAEESFDIDFGFEPPSPRQREQTPRAFEKVDFESDPIDDEFFELAESLAAESSLSSHSYRGEPKLPDGTSRTAPVGSHTENEFLDEELTNVRENFVESSFVLEEVAHDSTDRPKTNMSAILLEARRSYDAGHFLPALEITDKILSRDIANAEAVELKRLIEGELERHYLKELGAMSKTPTIIVEMSRLSSLSLDHRAGFLLSQVDGMMTFEDILELSSMGRLETLGVLVHLVKDQVIA